MLTVESKGLTVGFAIETINTILFISVVAVF